MRIYVGNLEFETSEADLTTAFGAFGSVSSVTLITDPNTGRARGFGFVEMGSASEAQAAIAGLNGKELRGRVLTVNEARERQNTRRPSEQRRW